MFAPLAQLDSTPAAGAGNHGGSAVPLAAKYPCDPPNHGGTMAAGSAKTAACLRTLKAWTAGDGRALLAAIVAWATTPAGPGEALTRAAAEDYFADPSTLTGGAS